MHIQMIKQNMKTVHVILKSTVEFKNLPIKFTTKIIKTSVAQA